MLIKLFADGECRRALFHAIRYFLANKIVSFLQFFVDISKKSKAVIAIYVYASESSRFSLLENSVGYYAMS